ncbi:peptidylprolyl isomerase [Novipirellula artificiosorum]|uniref:peptidylprolyl isomerase n=1 Tax=Novipirellula artificiosorum TaxID=2528016 RepID=A0A5C6DBU4_9BACT|nr:peptidylprolyl isomerase [Novipirellula artificiosorum]TWU33324.1 putative peptidyl-prolyl cis-trans isomerase [Novipirellula artificiosorum]
MISQRLFVSFTLLLLAYSPTDRLATCDAQSSEVTTPSGPETPEASLAPASDTAPAAAGEEAAAMGGSLPIELTEEGEQAKAEFLEVLKAYRDKVTEMRVIHTRYINGEQQTPEARQSFVDAELRTRQLMDDLFEASYKLLMFAPDEEAAQYLLTMIQHQYENSNYSEWTLQAGSLLMDLGFKQIFLYRAVARAAVCTGHFELARKVYKHMDEEGFADLDKRFSFQMDEIEQLWQQEAEAREADATKNLPRVLIKTTKGDMVVELFLDVAPSTVANFISLVEQGFYDGLDFYQVKDDLLALTGDETGLGSGDSGRYVIDEHQREGARNAFRGSLAMAKLPSKEGSFFENTASTQFAIFFTPLPAVSQQQTVFGRVIEGMDLFTEIRRVDPNKDKSNETMIRPPDRIITAEVLRKPEEMPEPVYFTP